MDTDAESRQGFVQGRKAPSRRRTLRIAIGIGLAVALIAVVSVLTGGNVTNGTRAGTSALVGHHLANFTIAGLSGGEIKASWESHRASVIIFFASFCGPCQREMPKVAKYVRTHDPGDVEALAVDADDKFAAAQTMVEKDGVTFPVAFDPNGAVTSGIFGFEYVPQSVFVNAHGVVVGVNYGAIPERQLAAAIVSLRTPRAT